MIISFYYKNFEKHLKFQQCLHILIQHYVHKTQLLSRIKSRKCFKANNLIPKHSRVFHRFCNFVLFLAKTIKHNRHMHITRISYIPYICFLAFIVLMRSHRENLFTFLFNDFITLRFFQMLF